MLFHDPSFIFIFLPIALLGYYSLAKISTGHARLWLLGASVLYYSLGRSANLLLLLSSILCNFYLGRLLSQKQLSLSRKKGLLIAGLFLNIGILVFFKCKAGFGTIEGTASKNYFLDVLIPLGLSFFTLQQVAFLVDSFKGKIRENRLLRYALFISFFPQLIAGPIVRYQEMVPQLKDENTFRFRYSNLAIGLTLFILGALKKVFIADQLALASGVVFSQAAGGHGVMLLDSWLGALSFYFQLYYDFSAYSDMALGAARMFGIILPMNFNSPYRSQSLSGLFLAWHMTLYRFLTDYLMLPLISLIKKISSGSALLRTRIAICVSTMVTFTISGLWHGASWNFALWGLFNGGLIALVYLKKQFWPGTNKNRGRYAGVASVALTVLTCIVASVIFRCQSVDQAMEMFRGMVGLNGIALPVSFQSFLGDLESAGVKFQGLGGGAVCGNHLIPFPLLIIFCGFLTFYCPNIYDLTARFEPALGIKTTKRIPFLGWDKWIPSPAFAVIMAIAAAFLITLILDPEGTGSGTFIYFHF